MSFNRVSIFLVIIILSSCGKAKEYPDTPVIGHAITGLYNPESIYHDNTREAFEYALLFSDLAGVEVDVQLSLDGTLWLYHDIDLSSQTDFSGSIGSKTDEELENIKYNSFHRESLVRLDQIVFPSHRQDMIFYVDLKYYNTVEFDTLAANKVINSLKSFEANNPSFMNLKLILRDLSYLNYFEQNGFTALYSDAISYQDASNKKSTYPLLDGVFVKNQGITKDEVQQLKSIDLEIIIFELNSVFSIREAKSKLPNAILPIDFKKALKEQ
jgi:glycerophosphoryl diester phosphodiesterase